MIKWSLRIGQIAGIGIFVHWTFSILLVWFGAMRYSARESFTDAAVGVALLIAVFACVLLHELGHALTAQRFGIPTRDITLLPIGGVARLERMPEDPMQELIIAAAGPLVNVVIAGLLLLAIWVSGGFAETVPLNLILEDAWMVDGGDVWSFMTLLTFINVMLVLFNLLPAFPMDGGRVFRAILTRSSGDYEWATQVAATVGQVMAVVFFIVGILSVKVVLILIALFVFLGAQAEANMVQMRSLFRNLHVRDAMMSEFHVLEPEETLDMAAEQLLAGAQQDFPVLASGKFVGVLERATLVEALRERGGAAPVADVMRCDVETVAEDERLESTLQRMQQVGFHTLPVMRDGELVGLVTLENVGELVMLQTAQRQHSAG
jgi:Zn-dependent protease